MDETNQFHVNRLFLNKWMKSRPIANPKSKTVKYNKVKPSIYNPNFQKESKFKIQKLIQI